ncbi:MAG: fasciclin domain-containing protein [Phycisphaerae bacterium]|nr:fasciclin domain-containing protein [Phycisphaerae bacterium]
MKIERKLKDIVETASSSGDFSSLCTAVKAAGLIETLQGEGPFTVFAPNDEAFSKLESETINALLNPANKDKLTAILTYHVVPGKVMADDVMEMSEAQTVNGTPLSISIEGNTVMVDDASVIKTDIECSNGVIHVIDTVVIPE